MSHLRRDFLAFSAGALAARTVLPAVAKAEPAGADAALFTLCAAYHRFADEAYRDDNPDWEKALDAACRMHERVLAMVPATEAGHRQKLAVGFREMATYRENVGCDDDVRFVIEALRDWLGTTAIGGGAA